MKTKSDEKISASIDVIIAFKKGAPNRSEASRFSFLTGLDPMFAERFFSGLTRENVVELAPNGRTTVRRKTMDSESGTMFYDVKTSGLTEFDQIFQFAAVVTDADFNEIDAVDIRAKRRPHIVPAFGALRTTGVTC